MEDLNNYQGGGDIRLGRMVGGVFDAFVKKKEKDEALAREKALREEKDQNVFLQKLSDTMAKVPTKGLQQKDIPGFKDIYDKMETAYVNAYKAKDKGQRLLEMAKVKQYATEATLYTQQSEASGKKKAEYLKMLQNNYEKYNSEAALEALNAHYDKPLSEVTTDFDIMQFRNKWDSAKLDKSLDDLKKDILTSSTSISPKESLVGSVANGYDTLNTFRTTRTIPEADAVQAFKNRYSTDDNFKRYVDTEFDGPLDSKFTQLYQNLSGAGWATDVKDTTRVQGRAPRTSGGSGGRSSSSASGSGEEVVQEGVDIMYSYDNVATASKQLALKGNGMKARLGKGVRAYDVTTGEPLELTTGMQDGVIQEFVQLPTGSIKGKGRRVLAKGTEDRFKKTKQYEDFAVVRYRKPVYTFTGDNGDGVFTGTGEQLGKALRSGIVKATSYEEVTGLFPMNSVLPAEESMTKGERAAVDKFRQTKRAVEKPATKPNAALAKKVLGSF